MSRSVWKGPFVNHKLIGKVYCSRKKSICIKTWSKNSYILPEFAGLSFDVYNGRVFINIKVTSLMVGRKMGEFIETRKFLKHANAKK